MAKNQVVSIDIGTNAIKFVQLEQTASGIRLVSAGFEAYPRQSAMEDISAETISKTLQSLWRQVHGGKYSVALSIPRLLVTSRRLTNLPAAATEEQLPSLVAMQAETELPFRIESAVYDYHDVRRSDSSVSVELIAAKREAVQQQLDYLKSLALMPKTIIPSSLATGVLAGAQRTNLDEKGSEGMTMVLDIGAGRTDLCLMGGNTLRFSRSFPIGGNHLTHLYQSETGGDFESAESWKIAHASLAGGSHKASDTLGERSAAPTYQWAGRLVSELKRTISAAKRELNITQDAFVSEIWLCGGGSRIAGLTDYIADQLQIPARLWNPLDAFKAVWDERQSGAQSVEGFSDTLAVALGLGINALTNQIALDLLPKEEKAKLTQTQQRRRTLSAIAAGLILLVGLGLSGLAWSRAQQAKIAALDQELLNIKRVESKAQKALVKDLAVASLLTPRVSPLDILRELSIRFADRTKVAWTTFHISHLDEPDKAKITFNIEAESHQDVSKMISMMGQSGVFTNIKSGQMSPITSTERDKKPIFQVQVTCNLAPNAAQQFAQARFNPGKKPRAEAKKEEMSQEEGKSSDGSENRRIDEPPIGQNEIFTPQMGMSQRIPEERRKSGETPMMIRLEGESAEKDKASQHRLSDEAAAGQTVRRIEGQYRSSEEHRSSDEAAVEGESADVDAEEER